MECKPKFSLREVDKSGFKPPFSTNESYQFVITITEIEEDAYKIKVEELFKDGRRVDLLHRDISILGFPTIFESTDLHLTKEAAQELWQMIGPSETSQQDLTLDSSINSDGQRFVEILQYSKNVTLRVIHHLERIAESLHAQRKRQAKAEAKAQAKACAKKGGSLRKSSRVLHRRSRNTKHY